MTTTDPRFRTPFTTKDSVFLFIDHQERMVNIVGDQPKEQIRQSVVSVAKAARALGVPIILSSASPEIIGPTMPELTEVLSDVPNIERTVIGAWDDERIREAVRITGRRRLIFGAIGTNVCLTQATIGALVDGYEAYAAIDISGTSNELLRSAAIEQMVQAGVGITTATGAIFQMLRDNADPKAPAVYEAMGPLLTPSS